MLMVKCAHEGYLWTVIRIEDCNQHFPQDGMKIWKLTLIYVASGVAKSGVGTFVTHRGCSWKILVQHDVYYHPRGLLPWPVAEGKKVV